MIGSYDATCSIFWSVFIWVFIHPFLPVKLSKQLVNQRSTNSCVSRDLTFTVVFFGWLICSRTLISSASSSWWKNTQVQYTHTEHSERTFPGTRPVFAICINKPSTAWAFSGLTSAMLLTGMNYSASKNVQNYTCAGEVCCYTPTPGTSVLRQYLRENRVLHLGLHSLGLRLFLLLFWFLLLKLFVFVNEITISSSSFAIS